MNIYGMIGIAFAVGIAYFVFCFCWFTIEPKPEKLKLVRETKHKVHKAKCKKAGCKCSRHSQHFGIGVNL